VLAAWVRYSSCMHAGLIALVFKRPSVFEGGTRQPPVKGIGGIGVVAPQWLLRAHEFEIES